MARPKSHAAGVAVTPGPALAEEPKPSITKAEAIRQAMAEGIDDIGEIADFIRAKYGHDMSKPMVSSYKAQQKARDAKKAQAAPAPRRGRPAGFAAAPKTAALASSKGDLIDDVVAVKQLVEKLGSGQVRKLIELFE